MKLRLRDIAERAKVSPATVSNALNGRGGVSKAVQEQILEIAREMGYQPSRDARRQRQHVRMIIYKSHGMVIEDTPFFAELTESIQLECRRVGLELLISHIHARETIDAEEQLRRYREEECAGILLLGRPVIALLAGTDYLPAYPVTVLLMAGIIPMSYFKIIGTLLLAQGKKMVYLGMLTGSVVVNILCNLVTIPLWGKMGAAAASVASYAVAGGCFLVYYLRTYNIPVRDVFLFRPEEIARLKGMLKKVRRRLSKA